MPGFKGREQQLNGKLSLRLKSEQKCGTIMPQIIVPGNKVPITESLP